MEYMSREDYCEEYCGTYNREGYKTCHNCAMLNVPSVDVQAVDRWISVKDRLPEDDGKYMVWYKGELDICEFDVESQTFGYTYDDYDEMYSHLVCWDDGMDKDITHWMPLPEPPKDGDTECHDTK